MLKKIIVVVPAHNEAEKIADTISELLAVRPAIEALGYDFSVYLVNDGSRDDTADRAKEAGAHRIIHHISNQGLGAAVRTGLIAARAEQADIVIKFDADLQHDPKDIETLIQPILKDAADVVYGSRFENIAYKMPWIRRMGNSFFTCLMRWLTGWDLKDSQPGIFAVSSTYLQDFYLPGDYNYTQQILLDAYHKGMRFTHVPVTFRKRSTGDSFVSLRYPFRVLPQLIQVLVGVKPLRIFGPIGLGFLLVGAITFAFNVSNWFFGGTGKVVENVNAVLGFSLFGLQTLFFGLLADLIVKSRSRKR